MKIVYKGDKDHSGSSVSKKVNKKGSLSKEFQLAAISSTFKVLVDIDSKLDKFFNDHELPKTKS